MLSLCFRIFTVYTLFVVWGDIHGTFQPFQDDCTGIDYILLYLKQNKQIMMNMMISFSCWRISGCFHPFLSPKRQRPHRRCLVALHGLISGSCPCRDRVYVGPLGPYDKPVPVPQNWFEAVQFQGKNPEQKPPASMFHLKNSDQKPCKIFQKSCSSGYLPYSHRFEPSSLARATAVLHCHGSADQVVRLDWAEAGVKRLREAEG